MSGQVMSANLRMWRARLRLTSGLVMLVFVISLRHYFKQPTLRRAALLGSVLGLALLTKYSLVVLAPVCLLAMIAHAILLFARRRWPAGRRPVRPAAAGRCVPGRPSRRPGH